MALPLTPDKQAWLAVLVQKINQNGFVSFRGFWSFSRRGIETSSKGDGNMIEILF